jgi:DNA repair protein RadD
MATLRPYQQTALEALHAHLLSSSGYPLIDMATGTGKSLVIGAAVQQIAQQYPTARFLILAPRLELIEQDVAAITALWPEAPIGIVCEGLGRRDWEAPIVVGTVNSIYRCAEKRGPRGLIFVDEAHLIPSGDESMFQSTFTALLNLRPGLRIIGLTATPYRLDSGRLDEGDGRLFDQVIFSYGIGAGIADGWLAPLIAKAPGAASVINTTGVRRVAGEFNAGELERAADQTAIVEAAVDEIVAYAGRRFSWLVFCCGIAHAHHVCEALQARGVKAATVTGKTPDGERRNIFAAYRRGEIDCLTGADVFITGFDIPQVDLIALLRPTLSTSRYIQMVGRGTRKSAGKQNCLVLDFGGNVARHGPVDNPAIRTAKSNGGGGELVKVCPACKTFNALAATNCCESDHAFERKPLTPTHAPRPADLPILSTDADWMRARLCDPEIYVKPGRPESFKISYSTEARRTFRDWMAFAHGPGARWHAVRKWHELGGSMPAPSDAQEAMARWQELARDVEIIAAHDGTYWQVTARRVRMEHAA